MIISYFRAYFRNYAGMSTHPFSILTGNSEGPPWGPGCHYLRPHLEALVRLISPFFMISQYFLSHGQGSVGNRRPFAWATAADEENFGDAGVNVLYLLPTPRLSLPLDREAILRCSTTTVCLFP